ncbi:MAG: RNA-binding protein [Rhizobiaceae bacterium]|nr:RNA-binding protein [Rhizobiaceae bacterium]
MNDRTCIVTRQTREADALLRFVAGPDGSVVPDIRRKLPGRGCWVTADRAHVDKAAGKNLFARALKTGVTVPSDLGQMVDGLLASAALGVMGLARKAGAVALGAAKVDGAVRTGNAAALLHAVEASEDGVRKLAQARHATKTAGGPDIPAFRLFSEAEMGLALGATNVIHAALLASETGKAALRRVAALDRYRAGFDTRMAAGAQEPEETTPTKDME